MEEHDLNLNPSVLHHCVGDDASCCAVTEPKRLKIQPSGKRNQKTRKMDPEKRKASHIAAKSHYAALI